DVQRLLERLHLVSHAQTRLIVNFQNTLWRPLLSLAKALGLKARQPQNSWLASSDVLNLLRLSGWKPVFRHGRILLPFRSLGIRRVINRWLAPLLQWFCLTIFFVARRDQTGENSPLTVSVIIPARNEAGNVPAAVARTPDMGAGTELIFVEGHSKDETWAAIRQVQREHPARKIKIMQQTGRGKGDAVRLGFGAASGDVLSILHPH